jgi:putative transposase
MLPPASLLDGFSDTERARALERFRILQPYLEEDVPLVQIVKEHGLALRTVRRWVRQYRQNGLSGLCRKAHSGKGKSRMSTELRQAIEGLALKKPALSVATIYRQTTAIARRLGETAPSYGTVYLIIRSLPAGLVTMAHEGTKAYSESFDLVHRTEAKGPNAIWQADHTELDILVKDEEGNARRPWLTIILDDYSRAVAGYLLSFAAPSAIQTALALRQAIWRKPQSGWHVCGIPQVLYTDHGSDFMSHHIEQVAADLKMRLIFSAVGGPEDKSTLTTGIDR